MRTRTRKQDMLTVYIVGTTSKPDLRGMVGDWEGQPGHPFSELYRSMLCVSRVAAFDWFLCRLLKVFNTRFYYDMREGEGERERVRVRESERARVVRQISVRRGEAEHFPAGRGALIKCQFAALNGGFIGRHYNSYA